jgi:hypothetical protein
MTKGQDLSALRAVLFETLQAVKAGEIELDKARAVNDIGKTLLDSAKVEVDYLRATGQGSSQFLEAAGVPLPPGITSVRRHRLVG